MRILVACEFSGVVRDAFITRGHDAISCDLLPTEKPGPHYRGDVRDILYEPWDMILAFPPCTYLAHSGVRWIVFDNKGLNEICKVKDRLKDMAEAIKFFKLFLDHSCKKICIENLVPHKYARVHIGKYNQIVYSWQHGHPEKKKICLWLKGLPELKETNNVKNQMNLLPEKEKNRIYYMGPGGNRSKKRSIFYTGVAEAMATQWE